MRESNKKMYHLAHGAMIFKTYLRVIWLLIWLSFLCQ